MVLPTIASLVKRAHAVGGQPRPESVDEEQQIQQLVTRGEYVIRGFNTDTKPSRTGPDIREVLDLMIDLTGTPQEPWWIYELQEYLILVLPRKDAAILALRLGK